MRTLNIARKSKTNTETADLYDSRKSFRVITLKVTL